MSSPSTAPQTPSPSHPPPPKGKRRKRPAPAPAPKPLLCLVPPPPPSAPDNGIWGSLDDYEYQSYIAHIRRIKDPAKLTKVREKAQALSDGVLGVVDRLIGDAVGSMETKHGAEMVLYFAYEIVSTAADIPEEQKRHFKVIEGGTPPPPPPPADEKRRS